MPLDGDLTIVLHSCGRLTCLASLSPQANSSSLGFDDDGPHLLARTNNSASKEVVGPKIGKHRSSPVFQREERNRCDKTTIRRIGTKQVYRRECSESQGGFRDALR